MARKAKSFDGTKMVKGKFIPRFRAYVGAPQSQRNSVAAVRALWDKNDATKTREGSEDSSILAEVQKIARLCKTGGNKELVKLEHPAIPAGAVREETTLADLISSVKVGK